MKTLKSLTVAIMLLSVASYAFAASADNGDFVVLGRSDGSGGMISEKVFLYRVPGNDEMISSSLSAGSVVQVLNEQTADGKTFYIVSTVGKDGGLMGWVSSEYIYEVTSRPQE